MSGSCRSAMRCSSAGRAMPQRHAAKVWGLPPELAILFGAARRRRLRPDRRRARDPPPGHLFRHDHAGAGADDVLLRGAGAVHRRRGRHPGGAARKTVRPDRPRQPDQHVFHRARDLPRLASCSSTASSIRRSARCSRRSARTSRARSRSATAPIATSSLAFVLSATFAGLAGATKAIVFQLASLTDVDWPMSGEVVLMTLVGGLGTMFGPVVGAFFIVTVRELPHPHRPMGAGGAGRDLRRLRAAVPPRHRRRVDAAAARQALITDCTIGYFAIVSNRRGFRRSPRFLQGPKSPKGYKPKRL